MYLHVCVCPCVSLCVCEYLCVCVCVCEYLCVRGLWLREAVRAGLCWLPRRAGLVM